MTINIWYRYMKMPPEIVDRANSRKEANHLFGEYLLAFGCTPGQHNHKKAKLWVGRRDQEPKDP